MIGADEARAAGFLSEIVPPENLDAVVSDLCERLVKSAPLTQEVSKEALRRLTYANVPDMDDLIRRVYGSEDFRRGVRGFLGKTPPEWSGRVARNPCVCWISRRRGDEQSSGGRRELRIVPAWILRSRRCAFQARYHFFMRFSRGTQSG